MELYSFSQRVAQHDVPITDDYTNVVSHDTYAIRNCNDCEQSLPLNLAGLIRLYVDDNAILVSCLFIHAMLITYIQWANIYGPSPMGAVAIYTDESIFPVGRHHSDAFGCWSALIG